MSNYELNKAIHTIYIVKENAVAFKAKDYSILDRFDLSNDECEKIKAHDFPGLFGLGVHPVLLFHLSAILYPRDKYVQEVVPKLDGVPNAFYDYYFERNDNEKS